MLQEQEVTEPDWDSPLPLRLTPALLMHSLMATATAVHTGYASCVDDKLVVNDLISTDGAVGNYVRLVEQDFYEEEDPDTVWHDWTLEISIGKILTTGHWQIPANASPDRISSRLHCFHASSYAHFSRDRDEGSPIRWDATG